MNQTSPPPANGGPTARLLLSAPDRPGLVAAVANFIYSYGGDVTQADQHNDEEEGMFFQRVEFRLDNFQLSRDELPAAHIRTGCAPQYELERAVLGRRAPRGCAGLAPTSLPGRPAGPLVRA